MDTPPIDTVVFPDVVCEPLVNVKYDEPDCNEYSTFLTAELTVSLILQVFIP